MAFSGESLCAGGDRGGHDAGDDCPSHYLITVILFTELVRDIQSTENSKRTLTASLSSTTSGFFVHASSFLKRAKSELTIVDIP